MQKITRANLPLLFSQISAVRCGVQSSPASTSRRLFFSRAFASSSTPVDDNNNNNNKNEQQKQPEPPTNQQPSEPNNINSQEKMEELEKKVGELEKSNKELKDHYLRALAESENLRDRTRREKEMAQQLAIKSFAKDLLNVADILDLALDSIPLEKRTDDSNPLLKNLYTGLSMTEKEMMATFKRHGLETFDPVGVKFDPNEHQAMFQAPVDGKEPGTVFSVQKKGYRLHGIVLRAAQVGVVQEKS